MYICIADYYIFYFKCILSDRFKLNVVKHLDLK